MSLFTTCEHGVQVLRLDNEVLTLRHGGSSAQVYICSWSLRYLAEAEGNPVEEWFNQLHEGGQ